METDPNQIIDFTRFIEWGFMAMIAGGITWSAKVLSSISKNIAELNTQVASILEKITWHEKEIAKHDGRITKLEEK